MCVSKCNRKVISDYGMHLVMQSDIFLDTLNPVCVLKTCSIYSAGDSTQIKSVTTMLT